MKRAWKILPQWLQSRRMALLYGVLFIGILFVVYGVYGLPWGTAGYAALLGICLGGVFALVDILGYAKRQYELEKLAGRFPTSGLPAPGDSVQQAYTAAILALEEERARLVRENHSRQKQAEEYYTLWVHQVKTPIAAARLLLQSERETVPPQLAAQLTAELFRVEQYAGMALGYQRLATMQEDMQFATHSLSTLANRAVKNMATLFITKGLAVKTEDVQGEVVTDEKWFLFVLEQVLSNAAKYTPAGTVRLYTGADNALYIQDTGIGIPAQDLPRVFQRGFTGVLGRADSRSTGLGLYLCREVCTRLGFPISVESRQGKGTCVRIDVTQKPLEQD